MVLRALIGGLAALSPLTAAAQQPVDWQEIALRQQQSAAQQVLIDNSIIAALQRENADLKQQLSKAHADPPPPEQH